MARAVAQSNAASPPPLPENNAWGEILANIGLAGQGVQQKEQIEYLWPDNKENWLAWQDLQTQWRVGMAGPTGLDYSAVISYMGMIGRRKDKVLFDCIQAAEMATLEVWAEQRAQAEEGK